MTIKELKIIIQDLPDDTLLLVGGRDHSYSHADAEEISALVSYSDPDYIYEDYGDENKDNKKDKRISALFIS